MTLFNEKLRENFSYAKNKHNSYQFYDESAKNKFIHVRERMNCWFSRYPLNHQAQLKSDFKAQFDSAYFELFIHELFYKQGFYMKPHIELRNSAKTPDFLGSKENIELYFEAKVATDLSVKEATLNDKKNMIFDAINEISCKDFLLSIYRLELKKSENPKINAIKSYIQQMVRQRRDELESLESSQNKHNLTKEYHYSDDRVAIKFSLSPSTFAPEPFLVSQPGMAFLGGSDESIRKAVREKAKRYGMLDKPFIVCINATSYKHTTETDVFNAIFGFHLRTQDGIQVIRHPDITGIFNSNPSKFINVSAVFVTRTYPGNPHSTEHWLVENPFAKRPVDFDKLETSYFKLVDDRIVEIPKATIPEILFGQHLSTEIETIKSFLVD